MLKNKIYICYTYYHILISVIKTLKSSTPTDIIICNINHAFENGILERVRSSGIFQQVIWWNEDKCRSVSKKKIFQYLWYRYIYLNSAVCKYIKTDLKKYSDVYIYCDITILGQYLIFNRIPYHLMEDSQNGFQYKTLSQLPIYDAIIGKRFLLKIGEQLGLYSKIYGKSNYCLDIEVNSLDGLLNLKHIRKKAKVVNKDELFSKMPQNQIKQILELFSGESIEIPNVQNLAIIFTQPLYQDQIVESEQHQKAIYESIIEMYKHRYTIVIKPHPRDNVEYNFNEVIMLSRDFPSEIISLAGLNKFQAYITLYSTSVYTYPKDKVIFLGKDYINTVKTKEA